jgi:hypothetical protein
MVNLPVAGGANTAILHPQRGHRSARAPSGGLRARHSSMPRAIGSAPDEPCHGECRTTRLRRRNDRSLDSARGRRGPPSRSTACGVSCRRTRPHDGRRRKDRSLPGDVDRRQLVGRSSPRVPRVIRTPHQGRRISSAGCRDDGAAVHDRFAASPAPWSPEPSALARCRCMASGRWRRRCPTRRRSSGHAGSSAGGCSLLG